MAVPTKSITHTTCGTVMPIAHMDASSGLSIQMPISVRISATSQKYRKLVQP